MRHTEEKASDLGAIVKRIRIFSAGVLLLLFGFNAPIYAKQQQGQDKQQQAGQKQKDNAKKQGDQKKQPQQRSQQQPRQQQKQPQQRSQQQPQQQQKQPQQRSQEQPQQQQKQPQQRTEQQQAGRPSQQGQRVQRSEEPTIWQQHRASNWQAEHRTWQQRGGYNGYRIPTDHFRGYFGPSHSFRIFSLNLVMFGGYPTFQYGGYWISLLDPWPQYWSNDWYQNDDLYIDYSGEGYYLYNRRYPGDRIAIEIYMN